MRLWALLWILAIGAVEFAWAASFGASAEDGSGAKVVTQLGHAGRVTSVALSPDGRLALSGSTDNTLKVWDAASGGELRSFTGHTGVVTSVAFSPDGRLALSGSWDKTLKLWEVKSGRELRSFTGHADAVKSVAFSPDGRLALSGSYDKALKLWEVASGRELRSFTGHTSLVESVAFSPDGRLALSGSGDNMANKPELKMWDVISGRELLSFAGHAYRVASVAFSPDGRLALSGSEDKTLKLWDVASGRELRSFTGHALGVSSVAFSPDGKLALSGSEDKTLKLWEVASGRELRSFTGHTGWVASAAVSSDGQRVLSGGDDKMLKLWELATGRELSSFTGHTKPVSSVGFSPDGRLALTGGYDNTVKLWEAASGRELRTFAGHTDVVTSVAFSPDGRLALSGSRDKTLKLWEVATGRELRTFTGHKGYVAFVLSVAFSPDGRFALSGSVDQTLKLWDVASGRELRTFSGHSGQINSVAFSPDGRLALSGSYDNTVKLWEVASGRELISFARQASGVHSVAFSPDGRLALSGAGRTLKLWEVASGRELISFAGHAEPVESVAFSPDGRLALSGSLDGTLKLWDAATGKELRSFSGHTGAVSSVAFSPDGRFALSGSGDGTARIWDAGNGQELARMMATPDGEWLTITPDGFFSASHRDTDMLSIVRGVEATTIGQVHQSLFNPDLVREALVGDPGGEVRRAAEAVNLEKILDSGPAPAVAIASHPPGSQSGAGVVTVAVRVTDRGKGIGRIEWRVNGVTAGVTGVSGHTRRDYDVKQQLALDPGENKIEVIAYNGRNLLASLPARTTIDFTGPADSVKPKLHILAIGINAYTDKGWTPPGSSVRLAFPPLSLAVADAKAFAAEMQIAGAGMYSEVRITQALDSDATAAGLDRIVQRISGSIDPRDTFVLFAAAHGISESGRFYLIPQDYQGGNNSKALASRAIGQERLQDWIANRIKAKKALILLDTCESGALVSGYTKSRTDAPASEAAIGRLHEATGRPVLTAAASGKPAFEGYKHHGVFTWALIDALHNGDSNGDGVIELSELVSYVQDLVPKLAAKLNGRGVAAVAIRGFTDDKQSAHFGSTGEDFAIVRRLQ